MGILRDAIGAAMGSGQINNGLQRPGLPFLNQQPNKSPSPYRSEDQYYYDWDRPPPHEYPSTASAALRLRGPRDANIEPFDQQEYEDYQQSADSSYNAQIGGYIDRSMDDSWQMGRAHPRGHSFTTPGFRPVVLPQIAPGDGQPFLRGYSSDLRAYSIGPEDFIALVDALNVANTPSPENQIFQKGANIAGWFIPGAGAAIGLMAGQVVAGAGAAYGHSTSIANVLSRANVEVFVPRGLEICIGNANNLDAEVNGATYEAYLRPASQDTSPMAALASYGDSIARLTIVLQPLQNAGRTDPIAMVGQRLSSKDSQKKAEKAAKDAAKGKDKKMQQLQGSMSWLIVRRASPEVIAQAQAMSRK